MAKTTAEYGNDSIKKLEGPDRVRKRPGVIFGSDGLDGCEHSVFEIISNSIDEAREGYGQKIIVTKYADGSIEVQDFGAAHLLILIIKSSALTGSFYTVSFTPAVSITQTTAQTTSIR